MPEQKRTKRSYTDKEKGWVLAQLELNDGNVKGTARITGVPWETIRTWKRLEDKRARGVVDAKLKPLPKEVVEFKEKSLGGFIDQAEIVRDAAMEKLKVLIPQATVGNIAALSNLTMALSDRIDRAKGIVTGDVVEHRHTHAPSDEWVKALAEYAAASRQDALDREQEIIDVDVVEQPELGLPAAEGEDEDG